MQRVKIALGSEARVDAARHHVGLRREFHSTRLVLTRTLMFELITIT
jgi:hypothetical protein